MYKCIFKALFNSGDGYNPFSNKGTFLPRVLGEKTVLLTLGRVYGSEKIIGQSLYYFNPNMSFWMYKIEK